MPGPPAQQLSSHLLPQARHHVPRRAIDKHRLLQLLSRRRAQRLVPAMVPPAQPSGVPWRLAWVFSIALLYCDRAAPLLLSPQTGWHFGAAARWVWLTFAAAG